MVNLLFQNTMVFFTIVYHSIFRVGDNVTCKMYQCAVLLKDKIIIRNVFVRD